MQEMSVAAVGLDAGTSTPVVLLQEVAPRHRMLPVWVGVAEAEAIEIERQQLRAAAPADPSPDRGGDRFLRPATGARLRDRGPRRGGACRAGHRPGPARLGPGQRRGSGRAARRGADHGHGRGAGRRPRLEGVRMVETCRPGQGDGCRTNRRTSGPRSPRCGISSTAPPRTTSAEAVSPDVRCRGSARPGGTAARGPGRTPRPAGIRSARRASGPAPRCRRSCAGAGRRSSRVG